MSSDHDPTDGEAMSGIICEGFDPCPKCKQWPPPGTTAESYREHVESCGQPSKQPSGIHLRGPA